jgi:hypothetical protein
LTTVNNTAVNMVSLLYFDLNSFRHMPRGGIAG